MIGHALLPGFVAAGSGALVWTGVGDWPGCTRDRSCIRCCPYDTVRLLDLLWCALISIAVAVVVVAARHVAFAVEARTRARPGACSISAGLAVGVIAVGFRAVADRPIDLVLFSGQDALPALAAETSAGASLLVVLAKGVAYALSLGAGFRGGPVFPAIALGTALAIAAADIPCPGSIRRLPWRPGSRPRRRRRSTPFTGAVLGTLLVGSAAPDVAPFTVLAAAVGVLAVIALPDPARKPEPGDAGRWSRLDGLPSVVRIELVRGHHRRGRRRDRQRGELVRSSAAAAWTARSTGRARPAILAECRALRADTPTGCPRARWRRPPAASRKPRWVIHTVGPVWEPARDLSGTLRSCYTRSIAVADKLGATTVAFPLISAGAYGAAPRGRGAAGARGPAGHGDHGRGGTARAVRRGDVRNGGARAGCDMS